MQNIKARLQTIADKMAARNVLTQANGPASSEQQETYQLSRLSLIEQHELLAVILCAAVHKRHAVAQDFIDFINALKKMDRYDHLLSKPLPRAAQPSLTV